MIASVLAGVQSLRDSPSCPRDIQFFKLKSAHFVYKFLGIFSMITSAFFNDCSGSYTQRRRFIRFYNINPMLPFVAMCRHWSQFVWYRFLFILLSSYTYVNSYEEMLPTNLEREEEQSTQRHLLERERER